MPIYQGIEDIVVLLIEPIIEEQSCERPSIGSLHENLLSGLKEGKPLKAIIVEGDKKKDSIR